MRNPEQVAAEFRLYSEKKRALTFKIADAARAVLPVLLDAGRSHSAKQLQELFFELDACEQSAVDTVKEYPEASRAALLLLLEGARHT